MPIIREAVTAFSCPYGSSIRIQRGNVIDISAVLQEKAGRHIYHLYKLERSGTAISFWPIHIPLLFTVLRRKIVDSDTQLSYYAMLNPPADSAGCYRLLAPFAALTLELTK